MMMWMISLGIALAAADPPRNAPIAGVVGYDSGGKIATEGENGLPLFFANAIHITSNVVIEGDLEVHSTHQRAIYLPYGGIHLSTDTNSAPAPGQMFSKKVVTSTITLIGSAIIFQGQDGTEKARMTSSALVIPEIIVRSPDGKRCLKIGVDNIGAIRNDRVTCP